MNEANLLPIFLAFFPLSWRTGSNPYSIQGTWFWESININNKNNWVKDPVFTRSLISWGFKILVCAWKSQVKFVLPEFKENFSWDLNWINKNNQVKSEAWQYDSILSEAAIHKCTYKGRRQKLVKNIFIRSYIKYMARGDRKCSYGWLSRRIALTTIISS